MDEIWNKGTSFPDTKYYYGEPDHSKKITTGLVIYWWLYIRDVYSCIFLHCGNWLCIIFRPIFSLYQRVHTPDMESYMFKILFPNLNYLSLLVVRSMKLVMEMEFSSKNRHRGKSRLCCQARCTEIWGLDLYTACTATIAMQGEWHLLNFSRIWRKDQLADIRRGWKGIEEKVKK